MGWCLPARSPSRRSPETRRRSRCPPRSSGPSPSPVVVPRSDFLPVPDIQTSVGEDGTAAVTVRVTRPPAAALSSLRINGDPEVHIEARLVEYVASADPVFWPQITTLLLKSSAGNPAVFEGTAPLRDGPGSELQLPPASGTRRSRRSQPETLPSKTVRSVPPGCSTNTSRLLGPVFPPRRRSASAETRPRSSTHTPSAPCPSRPVACPPCQQAPRGGQCSSCAEPRAWHRTPARPGAPFQRRRASP